MATPISGEQRGMLGVSGKHVEQKRAFQYATEGMSDYLKYQEAMKAAGKPQAICFPSEHTDVITLSLGCGADMLDRRIEQGKATIKSLEDELAGDPVAKLTELMPVAKKAEGELAYITLGEYRRHWGREPKPQILTPDRKGVRWEYALDELAQELGLEERARGTGKQPDDLLKELIEEAKDKKEVLRTTKEDVRVLENQLREVEDLEKRLREGVLISEEKGQAPQVTETKTEAEKLWNGLIRQQRQVVLDQTRFPRGLASASWDQLTTHQKAIIGDFLARSEEAIVQKVEQMRGEAADGGRGICSMCGKESELYSGVCKECFIPWARRSKRAVTIGATLMH